MTRTERKAMETKHAHKLLTRLMKKVIITLIAIAIGLLCSAFTGDGSALFVIIVLVVPLLLTDRKVFIK